MSDEAFLLEAMVVGTSKAIENQEARGQREQVRSSRLPKDLQHPREKFEAAGIVFGEDVDDLFVSVTLPEGWLFKATDHSMWSKLHDEQGRERASIFYKAAFYDRKAHASLSRRLGASYDPIDPNNWRAGITSTPTDAGKPIAGAPTFTGDDADKDARAWLTEHYPDWMDPLAYWDLPSLAESK
jgi:hypothetical protein